MKSTCFSKPFLYNLQFLEYERPAPIAKRSKVLRLTAYSLSLLLGSNSVHSMCEKLPENKGLTSVFTCISV